MKKSLILLNGPAIATKNARYGGGRGGFVRNMEQYLNGFRSDAYDLRPCSYSVRQTGASPLSFVRRLFSDLREVYRLGPNADGIHILAQYRTAIYREFSIVLASMTLRLPVLYEIKAGIFIDWFESCRPWERWMARFILRRAKVILCEGQVYVDYLQDRLAIASHYFPNFVLDSEIPANVPEKLIGDSLRVMFVGFCYEGKGVVELVDGCILAGQAGVPVELTLVGQEHEDFTNYLDARIAAGVPCTITRLGSMKHDAVLALYGDNDVFCMPTRHRGEGHTNSVNEAMMMGMVIVSTRHGFLESVLGDDASYFLDNLASDDIARALKSIHEDRDAARHRAKNARTRLQAEFTSERRQPGI